ncbi:tRNA (guanine(46)-N(7))-methyltransferase TrmB [Pseudoroseicyclus tamaricis]|uniref:tRNA (guanine-N(7)-)-methyltransferase n=1 Tax=Pseudoroseicyclus tamaricis TaxID=2705421 RepID=A0A6B2K0M8_9RHOB|nr:tRNA (guanine(46)-N(7))-methyltransferase TrmB [Pseudoroseicyclus tamaricis]NDV01994.1 tRNA (guanosine(46)-N7)-methyltransferase TrmB [Pseudoroseicyclus tamaricis]
MSDTHDDESRAPGEPHGPDSDGAGPDGTPWRNFYGRIHGKTLRPGQKEALESDLGPLTLPGVSREENPERRPLDLGALFPGRPVWVEIGFGGGEHLVHMAARNPQVQILGAEPFVNGIAMLLGKIRAAGVENLALHPGDVRDLFDVLPEGRIEKAFLNYPDPWPKRRHHRRRFVNQGYLTALHRVLAPGAEFRVATDIPSYVEQTLREVPKAGFTRVEHPIGEAWPDWLSTRYEQKALREGRDPHYMTFRQA